MIFPIRIYSFSEKTEPVEILSSVDLSNTQNFAQLFTNSLKHDENLACSFIKTTLIICDLEKLQPECDWFISVWNRMYGEKTKLNEPAILKLIDLWNKNDKNYTMIIIRYNKNHDPQPVLNRLKKYRTISLLSNLEENNLESLMNWCRLSCMTVYARLPTTLLFQK